MSAQPPSAHVLWLSLLGAGLFGVVIGWVTYGSLRRAQRNGLTDITTVIGAVGGAAVTSLFPVDTGAFGAYCIGLALGFFGYLVVATQTQTGKTTDWLGESRPAGAAEGRPGNLRPPPT